LQTRLTGLLAKTINPGSEMGLDFIEVPDALIRLETLSKVPGHAPIAIHAGTPMFEIFEKYGRRLLILGAPGAGKTTLLRKLARGLLERAVSSEEARIPVIFELSNCAAARKPLKEWLVGELRRSYNVPRKIAKETHSRQRRGEKRNKRQARPRQNQQVIRRALQSFVSDADAPMHAVDQCVFKETGEPRRGCRTLDRVLQLLPCLRNAAIYTSDGALA
jgi:hypothetical protein